MVSCGIVSEYDNTWLILIDGQGILQNQQCWNWDEDFYLKEFISLESAKTDNNEFYMNAHTNGKVTILKLDENLNELWRRTPGYYGTQILPTDDGGVLLGGSYGYLNTGARVALQGKTSHSLSANLTRSDGYSRNKAGGLNADYSGGKAFYQGSYDDGQFNVSWYAGLSTRGFGSNTFYGAKWDDQYEHTMKTYTAIQAENKQGRFHLRPSIYWNHTTDRFELFRDAPDIYPFNYHRTDVYGVNLNSYFDWALGRTALGAELRNEDLVSGNLGEPLSKPHHIHGTDRDYDHGLNRTNISFVLEHNILLKRFTLSAGIVAVKNSWNEMNMRVYPGIDASYRIGDYWKIYASYNTSLRMPSATELYYSVGGHKADKHLKPEELEAVEGGIKYASRTVEGSLSIYHNHCKNLIDWIRRTSDADAPWESVNFTKVNATRDNPGSVTATLTLTIGDYGFTRTVPVSVTIPALPQADGAGRTITPDATI